MHFFVEGIHCTITQPDHFLSFKLAHERVNVLQVPALHGLDPSLVLKPITQQIVIVVDNCLLLLYVGCVAVLDVGNHFSQSSLSELFFGKSEVLPPDILQRSHFIHVGLL